MKPKVLKQNFSVKLFVLVSLASFILLAALLVFLKVYFSSNIKVDSKKNIIHYSASQDPLITKVPTLRDFLDGPIINNLDPSLGPDKAQVVIVIFSDFECQYCHAQEKVLAQVLANYEDKVRLIWKDYPSSDPDSKSFKAAVAGRCTQEQGKFWPFHDLLFASRDLDDSVFIKLAQELGLREKTFLNCLEDIEIYKLIYDNIIEAQALDINGIPFIYVGKQEMLGEISYEELESMVEKELNKH